MTDYLKGGTPGDFGRLQAAWEAGDAQGHMRDYIRGQPDFFIELAGGADVALHVALHHRLTLQYAVWCLAHNIAQAAAFKLQFRRGYWDDTGFHPGAP